MIQAPLITCFDLATKTGVATGRAGEKPLLETWDFSGIETRPDKLNAFDGYLERHFADNRIQHAYFEAPLPIAVLMQIGAHEQTIQLLRGLVGVLEASCARHGVPVQSWETQRARRAVIGQGRFKKGEAKRMVMRYCLLLGHKPANDNEGDALIGWLFESAFLNPRTAHLSTPLFAAG